MSICSLDNCNKLNFVMRNYHLYVWCVCVSARLCERTFMYMHVETIEAGCSVGSASLCLPNAGATSVHHHTLHFCMDSGDQTQTFMYKQQALY